MELGKKIASLRKMKNITQGQLAEYLSVQPQTISRWEADGGTPDVMLLPKIATFFEVSLDELFGMTDMEQINSLVYKYSVLRDEKSFEEVMRSIDIALHSLEEELANAKAEDTEDLKQRSQQLKAWKVHIYIQKSRGALEKAEEELDELRKDITTENPLYLPLKLQKQQFRIQMGETASVVKKAKTEWEEKKDFEALSCYLAALFDAQRSAELLQFWEQEDVQTFVGEVTAENEGLWEMMYKSAFMEQELSYFEKNVSKYREKASRYSMFEVDCELAELYKELGMKNEKTHVKEYLKLQIENLNFNEFMKERYLKIINEL